jgi:hypothetical protein
MNNESPALKLVWMVLAASRRRPTKLIGNNLFGSRAVCLPVYHHAEVRN